MDSFQIPATLEPIREQGKAWLNLKALRADMRVLANLAFCVKATRGDNQRHHRFTMSASDDIQLANLKERLTQLYALRALHRGKRHTIRRRVFGPGFPNGTTLTEAPVQLPSELFERYKR